MTKSSLRKKEFIWAYHSKGITRNGGGVGAWRQRARSGSGEITSPGTNVKQRERTGTKVSLQTFKALPQWLASSSRAGPLGGVHLLRQHHQPGTVFPNIWAYQGHVSYSHSRVYGIWDVSLLWAQFWWAKFALRTNIIKPTNKKNDVRMPERSRIWD